MTKADDGFDQHLVAATSPVSHTPLRAAARNRTGTDTAIQSGTGSPLESLPASLPVSASS